MSVRSWWRERRNRRRIQGASEEVIKTPPLREFVYLDEVSLRSILVSQNSTIPDNVSDAISRADEAEIAGALSTKALGIKSEVKSRYQSSNTNSTQSSRKAVVQTLFKEFRDLALDFKLVHKDDTPKQFKEKSEIAKEPDSAIVARADEFVRGRLIEVEVALAVDPVFKLGAMMTEWKAMADEFPGMFGEHGLLGFLRESEPIMKVLDRFLAELVPIKSKAVHYRVVKVAGHEYIVDKRSIKDMTIKSRPLYIVGVTEKLGYWKDLRRVLFSNARFTVMCRVARTGIHDSWTPVKLADLFTDVAPDFVNQINAIEVPKADDGMTTLQSNIRQDALCVALRTYGRDLIEKLSINVETEQEQTFEVLTNQLAAGQTSPAAQRFAFDQVRVAVMALDNSSTVDAAEDLAMRQNAREIAGLELLSSITATPTESPAKHPSKRTERILDVEVIGIYW